MTVKAQEAIQAAQDWALERSHQALDGEHLALVLTEQEDSLIPQLLQKLGVQTGSFTAAIEAELARRAKMAGATQVYPTQDFQNVFAAAQKEAKKLKDEFLST